MNHVLHMLPFLLAAGIAGAVHCAGMCGGLVVPPPTVTTHFEAENR
jgi:sulfite exporter TauE/SafE